MLTDYSIIVFVKNTFRWIFGRLDKTCGAKSPEGPIVCISLNILFKNVQIRHSVRLFFNYDEFQRFHRHLKNARSNRQSGPFFESLFELLTFDRELLRLQNLIIFDGYTRRRRRRTHGRTHMIFRDPPTQ